MKVAADKHMDVLKIGTLEWLEELKKNSARIGENMIEECEELFYLLFYSLGW